MTGHTRSRSTAVLRKLASSTHLLALVPSHHNHVIGERIGISHDVDHMVAFRA